MPTPGELLFQRLKGDSSGTDEDIAKESAEYLKNQSGMDRITIKFTVGDTTVTIPGQWCRDESDNFIYRSSTASIEVYVKV